MIRKVIKQSGCLCRHVNLLQKHYGAVTCLGRGAERENVHDSCRHFSHTSSKMKENIMNVFDRKAKRMQKNRTALKEDYSVYEYIREEMGYRMADRICDVKRTFDVAADIGCGRGHIAKHVYKDMINVLYQCDIAELVLEQAAVSPEVPTMTIQADEEFLPFKPNSLDLAVSSLSYHWVNDLPGAFKQVHHCLKNDGCFMGSMFGGDTLFELRVSLQLAETEMEGGFAPRVSPFTSVQDLGNLLNRAGFNMLTIDIDEMVITYPSMFELMQDLKGMGENNASWARKLTLHRGTAKAAAQKYKEMYGVDEGVPATFQIINFIGWKPDKSQKKPAQRGSGQISLKEIDRMDIDKLTEQIENLRNENQSSGAHFTTAVDELSEGLKKLKDKGDKDDPEKK